MATTKHATPGSISSILTTEMNSQADATNCTPGSAIDGTTNLDLVADFELNATWGTAPAAGTTVELLALPALDGTNHAGSGTASKDHNGARHLGTFSLADVTAAQRWPLSDVPLPPFPWKPFVRSRAGQTMAASGNTVKMRVHNVAST